MQRERGVGSKPRQFESDNREHFRLVWKYDGSVGTDDGPICHGIARRSNAGSCASPAGISQPVGQVWLLDALEHSDHGAYRDKDWRYWSDKLPPRRT